MGKFVAYLRKVITSEETIQILSVKIGKLETKSIGRLIDEVELPRILRLYLSTKDLDRYYRAKLKLKNLLRE